MGDTTVVRFLRTGTLAEKKAMLEEKTAQADKLHNPHHNTQELHPWSTTRKTILVLFHGEHQVPYLRLGSLCVKESRDTSPRSPLLDDQQPFELRNSSLVDAKKMFDEKAKGHTAKMAVNPFSGSYNNQNSKKLSRDDPNYGKPLAGSKSERRGKNAARHINAEVVFLCDMIYQEGHQYDDGTAVISFGDLFQIYTRISNKVVGILLRARKYGLVDFEGEILFQRRDDDVPILLLKPIQEIRDELRKDQEFEVGVCHKADSASQS